MNASLAAAARIVIVLALVLALAPLLAAVAEPAAGLSEGASPPGASATHAEGCSSPIARRSVALETREAFSIADSDGHAHRAAQRRSQGG